MVSFRAFELCHPSLKNVLETTIKRNEGKRPEFHVIFRESTVMTLEFHNAKLEPNIWKKGLRLSCLHIWRHT